MRSLPRYGKHNTDARLHQTGSYAKKKNLSEVIILYHTSPRRSRVFLLFMLFMVCSASVYAEGAVKLFEKHYSEKLVREGEL